MAVDADGVHLGQNDLPITFARKILGPGKIIGISTHSREEALSAQTDGADYIGFGPIFHSTTKDAGPIQGIENIRAVKSAINIPIIAIGGIAAENISAVMRAGADGVAVVSAVLGASDKKKAAATLVDLLRRDAVDKFQTREE